MINNHITFLQAKSNCSEEVFYFKMHEMITCTKFWTRIKSKLVHNNYAEYFRENKSTK